METLTMKKDNTIDSAIDKAKKDKSFVSNIKSPSIKHLFRVNERTQIAVPARVLNGTVDRKEWEKEQMIIHSKPLKY